MPSIITHPLNQTIVVGETVTFFVVAEDVMKYEWYFGNVIFRNGKDVRGANTNILTLTNVVQADAGNYFARVSNSDGSVDSYPATLTVVCKSACVASVDRSMLVVSISRYNKQQTLICLN